LIFKIAFLSRKKGEQTRTIERLFSHQKLSEEDTRKSIQISSPNQCPLEAPDHWQAAQKMRECFLWASLWKRIRQKVAGANSKK